MDPVQKALWFVESHSQEQASLEEIAAACNISSYHLTRAFAASTGLSLMRYVRARRLSRAARELARGAENIMRVALDVGYSSHEAFTRAFRDQFGLTPQKVREQGSVDHLQLVEPIAMDAKEYSELQPPRFETVESKLLAGLVERYRCESPAGIPDQWQQFARHLGHVPGQTGDAAYGVSYNFDEDANFDYMCGVEISNGRAGSNGLETLRLPSQRYAIFHHDGHVAGIRTTMAAIWQDWFPESGHRAVEAPTLEVYGPEFDGKTGLGGFEIWIPIEDSTSTSID